MVRTDEFDRCNAESKKGLTPYPPSDSDSSLNFGIRTYLKKQDRYHGDLSLHAILGRDERRFLGFSNFLKESFLSLDKFCSANNIPYTTLLTAFNYLKVHVGKQLSEKGRFKTTQDLQMIRVDAYVALRLAMKSCDSRLDLLVPVGQ